MAIHKIIKIHGLAAELGVAIQTIKNFEDRGILPKAQRDSKGWRYYTPEDIVKIKALYQEEVTKDYRLSKKSGNKKSPRITNIVLNRQ